MRTPGPPRAPTLDVTSGVGLQVEWGAPSATPGCEYGGDGGAAIAEYAVEWDVRDDFSSPAERVMVPASRRPTSSAGGTR